MILAGVSGYLVIEGSDCCGCFGRLAVHPWFSFGFNLAAIILLASTPVPLEGSDGLSAKPVRFLLAAGAAVFLSVWLMVSLPGYHAASETPIEHKGDGTIVVLDVEQWLGKLLPVMEHIDVKEKLAHGQWIVVLYHADCPQCYEVMKQLEQSEGVSDREMAMIEVPIMSGLAGGPRWEVRGQLVRGQLSEVHRWSVKTPAVLHLRDGAVVKVQTKF